MRIGIDIDDTIADTSKELFIFLDNLGVEIDRDKLKNMLKGDIHKEELDAFGKYIPVLFQNIKPKVDAKDVIDYLLKDNEIYIITARSDFYFQGLEQFTIKFLKDYNIKYSEIIFSAKDKNKICNDLKIDVMIDDSVDVINTLDTKGILFNSKVNEEYYTNRPRVNNWLEVKKLIDRMGNCNDKK